MLFLLVFSCCSGRCSGCCPSFPFILPLFLLFLFFLVGRLEDAKAFGAGGGRDGLMCLSFQEDDGYQVVRLLFSLESILFLVDFEETCLRSLLVLLGATKQRTNQTKKPIKPTNFTHKAKDERLSALCSFPPGHGKESPPARTPLCGANLIITRQKHQPAKDLFERSYVS